MAGAEGAHLPEILQGDRLTAGHVDGGRDGDVGNLGALTRCTRSASFCKFTLPLNGYVLAGSCASSMMTSTKVPPASSWWRRVVVKYMFPGMKSPRLE